jgi:hypothetical protein
VAVMDDKLKKELTKLGNDAKIHGQVIGLINTMKADKFTDTQMMACGIVITKIMQKRMGI